MKFIDEKGRLFGKINLIDLLVLLLVVAVAFAVIWKLGGNKAAQAVSNNQCTVSYTVVCEDVHADIGAYAESQIGAQLVNNTKLIDASISACEREESLITEGHETLYLTVTGTATFSENVYKVGSQEVRVGYEYILKTSEFELTGLISDLEVTHE